MDNNYVTKATGEREIYSPHKLCGSLVQSGASQEVAEQICQDIEKGITPDITTQEIWRQALRDLVQSDLYSVSARYSLRRGMANLGPDGYSFEKYIAVVLDAYGYKTITNQTLTGASGVEHEIDVVAEIDDRYIFIEAKYKNEYGLRTHVDTVMYGWARFLDLSEEYKKKPEFKDKKFEFWLVTNTEFTNSSEKFATYRGMTLLGWDYPRKHSLEDMIAEKKLWPVSILPSVSDNDRKALIHNGLILAQDLLPYTADDLENKFSMSPKRTEKIIAEARALMIEP